jgi:butyryl-CoA dehydrogenase
VTLHELGKVDASHSLTISAHTNLGTSPLVEFGTEAQRQRYVPLLASGKVMGGFGLTEPGAGSDAGGTATVAVKKGDHYVLNGTKNFITHGGVGEIFSVTARTSNEHGTRGITSFILTKDTCDLARCREVGVGHAEDIPKTKGFRAGKKTRWGGAQAPGNWRSKMPSCRWKRARHGGRRVREFPQDA